MRTMQLIEQAVTTGTGLDTAKSTAIARGWSAELFDRKVADTRKHLAKLQRPQVHQTQYAKAPKAPVWTAQEKRFTKPLVLAVTVSGPVASGTGTLRLTSEKTSTRADGAVFTGALGMLEVGAISYPVRISEAQLDRLAEKGITVWVGARAHKIARV